jgi:ATP-dependent Clp protease ATP-binding subunit ClpB
LNRIYEVIIFDRLAEEDLTKIVGLQLERVVKRLEKQNLRVEFTEGAKQFLAKLGYDPVYGARPLKRAIQKWLLDPLSLDVLDGKYGKYGKYGKGAKLRIDAGGEALSFVEETS